ncbi:hypothetical protein PMAYCL1PPCAC_25952, partial [Pristionchus mayeri]
TCTGTAEGTWRRNQGQSGPRYSPKVVEKYGEMLSYVGDKLNYATAKKDELCNAVAEEAAVVHEQYEEAREAVASGRAMEWAKEKMNVVVEKVKSLLDSYMKVFVQYVQVIVPFEFLGKLYETSRAKLQ